MPKFETCLVVGEKIFCWDELRKDVVEVELTIKNSQANVTKDVFNEVLLKLCKVKGLIKE